MRIYKKSTKPNESSGGNFIHLGGIYRPADHPVYNERRMYPQIGRLVTPADLYSYMVEHLHIFIQNKYLNQCIYVTKN